jgi:hypothetical protein
MKTNFFVYLRKIWFKFYQKPDPDPYWIQIRIRIRTGSRSGSASVLDPDPDPHPDPDLHLSKMLDLDPYPDPHITNVDPKHCLRTNMVFFTKFFNVI